MRPSVMVYRQHCIRYVKLASLAERNELRTSPEVKYRLQLTELPVPSSPKLGTHSSIAEATPRLEAIEILEVSECTWYFKLIALMFGFVMIPVGSCIYNIPAAPVNAVNFWDTSRLGNARAVGYLVAQYLVLLSWSLVVVILFTSVCVAVRMRLLSKPSRRLRGLCSIFSRRPILQELLWDVLILVLLIGVVACDWFVFDGSDSSAYKVLDLPRKANT